MMKVLVAALACFITSCHLSATAFAASACDGHEAPSIVVNSPPQPTIIDRSKGVSGLTALMGHHASLGSVGFVTLGVTSVDYRTSVRSSVQIKKSRSGDWCAYPVNIVVTHGFARPITVYIARELSPGSCKYDRTMEHEMRHVRYHEEGVWRASIEIDKAISAATRGKAFPITGKSSSEVSEAVNERVSEIVSGVVRSVSASVKASNDAMDTPEAYRAFSNLCKER